MHLEERGPRHPVAHVVKGPVLLASRVVQGIRCAQQTACHIVTANGPMSCHVGEDQNAIGGQ